MKNQNNFFYLEYGLLFGLYLFSIFTVVATAYLAGYENFLKEMTHENGVFETLTVIWLFATSVYGFYALYSFRGQLSKYISLLILAVSLLTFVAGMEEISWGQQLFHFESSHYFVEHNLQKETNLHNLVDANLFSSLIYSTIYTLFVFLPLLFRLFVKEKNYFDFIGLNHILIILFSSSFQLYFYNDFGVYADMATQVVALILMGYVLWREGSSLLTKIHYFVVLSATMIFMLTHEVFRFLNMQYEIREMFVTFGFLLIFISFIKHYYSLFNREQRV